MIYFFFEFARDLVDQSFSGFMEVLLAGSLIPYCLDTYFSSLRRTFSLKTIGLHLIYLCNKQIVLSISTKNMTSPSKDK